MPMLRITTSLGFYQKEKLYKEQTNTVIFRGIRSHRYCLKRSEKLSLSFLVY